MMYLVLFLSLLAIAVGYSAIYDLYAGLAIGQTFRRVMRMRPKKWNRARFIDEMADLGVPAAMTARNEIRGKGPV